MQTLEKKKEEEMDYRMLLWNPRGNMEAYKVFEVYEHPIMDFLTYGNPKSSDEREHMRSNRKELQDVICRKCVHFGKVTQITKNYECEVIDTLESIKANKLVRVIKKGTATIKVNPCEGTTPNDKCRALHLKQQMTKFIKGKERK